MDDADRAEEHIEKELEAAIQAARGIPGTRYQATRTHCPDCGCKLEAHRKAFGICIKCKTIREERDYWY